MNCFLCENYLKKLDRCKFCHFVEKEHRGGKWDILNLKEDDGWIHIQILEHLHKSGIDCYSADIWQDNMAFLVGCPVSDNDKLARVLGIHKECIYNDYEHQLIILNLFQEKYLRGELPEP